MYKVCIEILMYKYNGVIYLFLYCILLFTVPEPVYRMTNLKRLDLSHNQITELSSLIGEYKRKHF